MSGQIEKEWMEYLEYHAASSPSNGKVPNKLTFYSGVASGKHLAEQAGRELVTDIKNAFDAFAKKIDALDVEIDTYRRSLGG